MSNREPPAEAVTPSLKQMEEHRRLLEENIRLKAELAAVRSPFQQAGEASGTSPVRPVRTDFKTLVNSFERELIVEALKAKSGNVAAAARQLGLSERIIHYKIGKLGISPKGYRQKKTDGERDDGDEI